MGGLGQFADLRWGLGKKDGGVFEGGVRGGGGGLYPNAHYGLGFFFTCSSTYELNII